MVIFMAISCWGKSLYELHTLDNIYCTKERHGKGPCPLELEKSVSAGEPSLTS